MRSKHASIESRGHKKESIDLGLAIIASLNLPYGTEISQRTIADICDCSHQAIQKTEARALKKMSQAAGRKGLKP